MGNVVQKMEDPETERRQHPRTRVTKAGVADKLLASNWYGGDAETRGRLHQRHLCTLGRCKDRGIQGDGRGRNSRDAKGTVGALLVSTSKRLRASATVLSLPGRCRKSVVNSEMSDKCRDWCGERSELLLMAPTSGLWSV